MKSAATIVLGLALGIWLQSGGTTADAGGKKGKHLAHMVYFKLKDASPAAREKLVAACHKHLSGHEGTVYYSAGTVVDELNREVNDRDWDVGLHLVFDGLEAHNKYQVHPRHEDFIRENKDNWSKVRVFDSYVTSK